MVLAEFYPYFETLHIISVICWMAGMLYLPRIYVYHTKTEVGSEMDKTFQIMEKKLLRLIMNPSMISTFIFGLLMLHIMGLDGLGKWIHLKIGLVVIMAAFHGYFAKVRKDFEQGINRKSETFYRVINEVPAVIMIFIVFLVVIKPF